jgi:Ca2+-transporting ATPase
MTVRKIVAGDRIVEVSGAGYEPFGEFLHNGLAAAPDGPLQAFLQAGLLASDARIVRGEDGLWRVKGDPTEGALVVAAAKAGLDKTDLESRFPRVEEIPFASETKRMTTLHADWTAYSKGAVEVILRSCAFQLTAAGEVSLDENGRATILAHAQDMATDALRVLAVARKTGATLEDAEYNMTFLGLAGMIDPPRPESRAAIRICERAGIKVVMITGDHPLTAQAVARELGILKAGRVVTGAELEEMSTAELERRVESIEVYARVSPQHKLQIVTALQKQGHIVAMTGDGVNDAPALKRADIGVAMGITGTDVSREAAAMILTDDNFHSIVAAVEEGRGIYSNIKKYLMYLLSANIGEIGLIAATSLIGLPLPLSAVQILYVNLATDGLPALALAVDPADTNLMQRKPRDPKEGIFNLRVALLMLTGGTWSALVNTGLFVWVLQSGQPTNEAMTMTFVSLVLIEFFKAYCFRSEDWLWRRPFVNRWLNLAIVWELLLLSLILYVPFLQGLFGAHPLNQDEWTMVLGVAFSVVPVLEIAKWITRRLEARA